jgi:hypothetical protein
MTVYIGTLAGTTFVRWPICFTGIEAALARSLLVTIEIFGSAAVGAVVGVLISLIAGPEVLPQLLGLAVGAVAGAIAGGIIAVAIIVKGMCTCPPGTDGFCIALIFFRVPGTTVVLPIWPFAVPDPASCATLVPPGCP